MVLNTSQKILLGFVTLIIGIVMIGVIAGNALNVTELTRVGDETHSLTSCYTSDLQVDESDSNCNITVTNSPEGWVSAEELGITNTVVKNGTKVALTDGTDYNLFATQGLVQFLNTSDTESFEDNNTYIDYKYYSLDYLNLGWGRTILNLVAGFFALALLGVSVGLFYSVGRDTGLI